jgi:hypothetical protein
LHITRQKFIIPFHVCFIVHSGRGLSINKKYRALSETKEPFFFEMKNKINKPCCDNVYRLVKDKGGLSAETTHAIISQKLFRKNQKSFFYVLYL